MVGMKFIFLCALLLVAVQMNRVNSQSLSCLPELLKFFQEITSQLTNCLGQGSGGMGNIASMTQGSTSSSSSTGNNQLESAATSFIKMLAH